MFLTRVALFVTIAGLLPFGASSGPRPDPQERQPQPTGGVVVPQQPTFIVRIDLVTADVIVRDANGQFVADVKKEEFEVFEDDVKQEIASLVLTHGGRVYNQVVPPPPPAPEGIILPPQRPTSDAAGRIFLIFVDDLHLDFRNTGRIRELFKKIEKTLVHDGDMFGMVSTGPSSIAIDLTYDRKRLQEAIKKIAGNGLKPQDILDAPEGAEGPSEVRYRAHVAFSTAYDIMKNLEQVHNRRKAFVYVSNGYDFNPFPNARAGTDMFSRSTGQNSQFEGSPDMASDPFLKQGNQFADADLARELAELTRAANRANATIYTIDPRGLVGGPDLDEKIDPVEYSNYIRSSQDSLRVLAEETGGIAVVNQNDFDKALKRIDNETSDYYVIGYYSSNPDPLKRTRKVDIKVKRQNLTVFSRRSYSLRPLPPTQTSKP
ncbi:MAG: VWA domain-containing protein [Vicinamibacterales bacterium]